MKKLIIFIAIVCTTNTFASNYLTCTNTIVDVKKSIDLNLKPCPIKIQGTYDGKKIDIIVTVEANNCAKAAGALLKEFTKPEKQ